MPATLHKPVRSYVRGLVRRRRNPQTSAVAKYISNK